MVEIDVKDDVLLKNEKLSILLIKENIQKYKGKSAQIYSGHNSLTICLILLLSLPDYNFFAYLSAHIQLGHTNGHFVVTPIWPYGPIWSLWPRTLRRPSNCIFTRQNLIFDQKVIFNIIFYYKKGPKKHSA